MCVDSFCEHVLMHNNITHHCYVHVFLRSCICLQHVYAQGHPHNTLYLVIFLSGQGNQHPFPPLLAQNVKSARQRKGPKMHLISMITHLTLSQSLVKCIIVGLTTTVAPHQQAMADHKSEKLRQ